MSFAAMIGRRRQLVVPTPPDEPEEPPAESGLIYDHDFEDGAFPSQGPVIQSGLTSDITVTTTNPISGTRSLNFFFVGKPEGQDNWIEHNLALPKCYGGFGMEFDIRFSSNYVLRNLSNSTTKWFQFWQQTDANAELSPRVRTDYNEIMSVGASIRRNGVDNQIELMAVVTDNGCNVCNNGYALLMDPDTPENAPVRPGQKHKVKWRVKYSSALGVNDGLYELLVDDGIVFQNTALNLWPYAGRGSTPPFLSWGYLMGYANGGFGVDTNVQWDNLKMYNTTTRWW